MEVTLKMALRVFSMRQQDHLKNEEKKELGILCLKGSYHGDTIGAMDACEEGVYTCEWHHFLSPTAFERNLCHGCMMSKAAYKLLLRAYALSHVHWRQLAPISLLYIF